jgi:hypothetical protein
VKKLLLVALVLAPCGTGCRHHKPVATENYPPVFAPLSPMAAYKSSATGYPASSPRVGMGGVLR